MKFCEHCKAQNLDDARYCDSCGLKLPEPEPVILKEEIPNQAVEEVVADDKENTPPITPPETTPPVAPVSYAPYFIERKHGGLMAFSIINICSIIFSVLTLYMSFFSMIFGIIAAVTLNKAKNEQNDEYYKIKKRNALILNLVGLILGILGFIAFIGLVAYFIVTNLQGIGNSVL